MLGKISFSAIHTFTLVAKELSFTRAAELLHITPSAVSHQMKLLEAQLGVTLFHRKAKGVRLSLAGETLQQHAASGVRDIQHGIQQSQFAGQKEKLVVAVVPSFCQLWLLPRLPDFCEQNPNIEIENCSPLISWQTLPLGNTTAIFISARENTKGWKHGFWRMNISTPFAIRG